MRTRRRSLRLRSRKQRQSQKRQQHGGDTFPTVSEIAPGLLTTEVYDALPIHQKMHYERTKIIPLSQTVLEKIENSTTSEEKLYYTNMLMIHFTRQSMVRFLYDKKYAKTNRKGIPLLKQDSYVREHGTPEFFSTLDYLSKYIEYIDSINKPMIKTMISENKYYELEILMYSLVFRTLIKTDLSVSRDMFYGSDEMLRLLRTLFFDSQKFANPNMMINPSDITTMIVNLIDTSYDKSLFKNKLIILNIMRETFYVPIIHQLIFKREKEKLVYFIEACPPDSLIFMRPAEFPSESPFEYGEIIMRYAFENLVRGINEMNVEFFLMWIEWYYNSAEESIKINGIKHYIDIYFQKLSRFMNSSNQARTIAGYIKRTKINNNELIAYIVGKLIAWKPIDDPEKIYVLMKELIDKECKEGLKVLIDAGNMNEDMILSGIDYANSKSLLAMETFLKTFVKPESASMWEGWNQSDISKFDMIFSEDGVENYSICPICLKYVQRTDGCLYMSHNCAALAGFYHKKLYNLYAWSPEDDIWNENENENEVGFLPQQQQPRQQPGAAAFLAQQGGNMKRITWCTTCGRICYGHQHYKLGPADNKKAELYPHGRDPYEKDCRVSNHGGGFPEKVARYRRAREYALELQEEIGKLTEREALEDLVEQMWNAPFYKTRKVEKIIAEKAWNIPSNRFPRYVPPVETNAPNIPYTGLLPVLHEKETDHFSNARYVDDENILQFRHTMADGVMNSHDKPGQQISREAFRMFLNDVLGDPTAEAFGKCWQFYTEAQKARLSEQEKALVCTATLHPEEVKAALDMTVESDKKLYEGYRKQFNQKFRQ